MGRLAAVGRQVGGMQVAGDKQVEEADNQQVAAAELGHHPEQERQVKTCVHVQITGDMHWTELVTCVGSVGAGC